MSDYKMYHLARSGSTGVTACGREVGRGYTESAASFWAHSPLLRCRNCERAATAKSGHATAGAYRRVGARASASRVGQGMTGRVQRSGRRYERITTRRVGAHPLYIVYGPDGHLGSVQKTATGWLAINANGTLAVRDYGGSRDAAAAYLGGQGRNKRRRRPAGSMIRRHRRAR